MLGRASRLPRIRIADLLKELRRPRPSYAWRSPYFIIVPSPNNIGHNRFAVIVSKRVAKGSARRHDLKRQFIARLREWPNKRKDFLIIASPRLNELTKADFPKELERARARLLKG